MNLLFDINHPAHVHFFRRTMTRLLCEGHDIHIAATPKEHVVDLLRSAGFTYRVIDTTHSKSVTSMLRRLIRHDFKLIQMARECDVDALTAVGGTFAAHAGWYLRRPSIVFYDTGEAKLQNAITYPLASRIVVPRCYDSWTPAGRTFSYRGCHELAYLSPRAFLPEREKAVRAGLDEERRTVLLRLVSWDASHDIGLGGIDAATLTKLIELLSSRFDAKVIISSERELPAPLSHFAYDAPPEYMHHLMAFVDLTIGESATMASEAAVLGTPAILFDSSSRCYTRWLDRNFSLIYHVSPGDGKDLYASVEKLLSSPRQQFNESRSHLLDSTDDVDNVIYDHLTSAIESARGGGRK